MDQQTCYNDYLRLNQLAYMPNKIYVCIQEKKENPDLDPTLIEFTLKSFSLAGG